MIGSFVISLDCEGKWGMADKIGPSYDFITEDSLRAAYAQILSLFQAFDIRATFAFVGALALRVNEREDYLSQLPDGHYEGNSWARHYRAAKRRGNTDGWFCPDAFDMAAEAGHEIASHGFSHIPFDDPQTDPAHLDREMELAVRLARARGVSLKTFVYPRNRVARQDILVRHGIGAYRALLPPMGKIMSLVRETNIFEKAQPFSPPHQPGIVELPAGYFLNWQSGLRRAIPETISVARWRSILGSAAKTGRVAHLWLHPHNIISGPQTLSLLESILIEYRTLRDKGLLASHTQADLILASKPCEPVRSSN